MYQKYIKRLLDIFCALAAMVVFCWLYAIVAILVRIKLGSPVIFKQQRPGKIDPKTGKEKIFTLYKFRSMSDAKDEFGKFLPDDVRLTKFGKLLRSTSLDELPEALNILKGDMSVVGPRPLLVKYLPYYTAEERHRHNVRPGLTGLSQVSGDIDMTWERQLALDVAYAARPTLLGDVKIILMTVFRVFARGKKQYGGYVRGEFLGTQEEDTRV